MIPPSSSAPANDRAVIRRVRVRSSAGPGRLDPNTARMRLERALSEEALHVAGLPASAILCVRTLRDPRPGVLALDGGMASQAWQSALRGAVEREARSAARPIEGVVPPGATAVLFRDRAELLACIALDWARGALGERWWWRDLVDRAAWTGRVVPAQWLADARFVPTAARLLADRGGLIAFAGALEESEARALVGAVAQSFGVDLEERMQDDAGAPAPPRAGELSATLERQATEHVDRDDTARAVAATQSLTREGDPVAKARPKESSAAARFVSDVTRWAPEANAGGLSAPARALVLLGLTLARAPAVARDGGLRAIVRAWIGGTELEQTSLGSSRRAGVVEGDAAETRPASSNATEGASTTGNGAPVEASITQSRTLPREASATVEDRAISVSPARGEHEIRERGPPSARVDLETNQRAATLAAPHAPPRLWRPPSEESLIGPSTTTCYGGVFFLMNALLALEIYADFTQPKTRTIDVSPWTLLAELGRVFLGADGDPDDALWALLGDLAGPREGSTPWPEAWRVKPGWLKPFPEQDGWTWRATESRFRVEHPAGFALVDVAREADLSAQLSGELAPYGVTAAEASDAGSAEAGWLASLAAFLRARIHKAIGAPDEDASTRLLLRYPARVYTTDTRLDVHLALAALPIEVRFAGLDRDPGWVPAAGRFLAFHFD